MHSFLYFILFLYFHFLVLSLEYFDASRSYKGLNVKEGGKVDFVKLEGWSQQVEFEDVVEDLRIEFVVGMNGDLL